MPQAVGSKYIYAKCMNGEKTADDIEKERCKHFGTTLHLGACPVHKYGVWAVTGRPTAFMTKDAKS
jgi:hypothetical protein